jgi:electron-transferring-flavoprotein dehydrogenase
MSVEATPSEAPEVERQTMEVDIACAGFGPAMGGFLTTLTNAWNENPADPAFESKATPGMPLQVLCYERADDISSGVSGVVTRGEGIRTSFPELNPAEIPMAVEVKANGCSTCSTPSAPAGAPHSARGRCGSARFWAKADRRVKDYAFELPWTPAFLNKHGGLVLVDRPVQPVGRLRN